MLLVDQPGDSQPQGLGQPALAALAVEGVDPGRDLGDRIRAAGGDGPYGHVVAFAEDDVGGLAPGPDHLLFDPGLVALGRARQDRPRPRLAVGAVGRLDGPDVDIVADQEGLAEVAGPGRGLR